MQRPFDKLKRLRVRYKVEYRIRVSFSVPVMGRRIQPNAMRGMQATLVLSQYRSLNGMPWSGLTEGHLPFAMCMQRRTRHHGLAMMNCTKKSRPHGRGNALEMNQIVRGLQRVRRAEHRRPRHQDICSRLH